MSISHSIETLSGGMFDFDAPSPEMINVSDIASALGNTCRFGGHVEKYYSVAEHAVLVHDLVKAAGWPPGVCYAALHHDSHEAYLGDIPKPLKRTMEDWKGREAEVDLAIARALGVSFSGMRHPAIKAADELALQYEAAVLKPSGRAQLREDDWVQMHRWEVPDGAVVGYLPYYAAEQFLSAHERASQAV